MTPADPGRRRARLLLTLLAYTHTRFPAERTPALAGSLRIWLDTWRGVGRIVEGMIRLGYDVQLTRYGERGWRGTFYAAGREHSPTAATGSAFALTAWQAVQGAAVATLLRSDAA
jgi:hypothetical protein